MLWAARVLARAFGTVWELLSRLRRRLRRRPQAPDPVEELRGKLAEARERDSELVIAPTEPEGESAPEPVQSPAEPARAPAEPGSTDLEGLRRDVHERARVLRDEMRGTGESD